MASKLVDGKIVGLTAAEAAEIAARRAASEAPEAVRAKKLAVLTEHKWRIVNGGLVVQGTALRTDEESRNLITGAALRATLGARSARWKIQSGAARIEMTPQQVIGIALAVSDFVQACFDAEEAVELAIDDYATPEAVRAAFVSELSRIMGEQA